MDLAEVRKMSEDYLAGRVGVDAVEDWSAMTIFGGRPHDEVGEIFNQISLMLCEMTCSGSLRSEDEFRLDLRSLLDGSPLVAFYPDLSRRLDEIGYFGGAYEKDRDAKMATLSGLAQTLPMGPLEKGELTFTQMEP